MAQKANATNLQGSYYENVQIALETVKARADKDDLIFVGGKQLYCCRLAHFLFKNDFLLLGFALRKTE